MKTTRMPQRAGKASAATLKRIMVLATCLALTAGVVAFLVGCGGSASSSTASASSSAAAPSAVSASTSTADTSFLTEGEWTCNTCVSISDKSEHALSDVYNCYVMLINFMKDNKCYVYVDTNFTIVNWELSGNDITLTGDGTYNLTVEDNGEKIVWDNFQGSGYDLIFKKSEK